MTTVRNRPTRKNPHQARRNLGLALLILLCLPALASAADFIETGSYTGDGNSAHAITGLGFQPDVVIIKATGPRNSFIKTATMPGDKSKRMIGERSLQSNRIISLDGDGFSVGSADPANEAGEEFFFIAMKAEAGSLEIGSYVGDGAKNRTIDLVDCTPTAALIMPDEAERLVFRNDEMGPYEGYGLDQTSTPDEGIASFRSNALRVSSWGSGNTDGVTYHYLTWAANSQTILSGTYTGNNNPGRDILGLGMNPDYLLIANDAGSPAVHRPAAMTGNASLFFAHLVAQNNLIQAMWDGGFQVGSDNSVNAQDKNYFWLALANPPPTADLEITATSDDTTPAEGQTITLTISIRNLGPEDASGVSVSSPLPAGLTFQSSTPNQGSYDSASGAWTLGDLAAGQSRDLVIQATVDAGTAASTLTHTASIAASDVIDPDHSNDTTDLELHVSAASGADLMVDQVVDDQSPDEGQAINYTIRVTNNGPEAASGIQIDMVWQPGLTFVSATPEVGTFDSGNFQWDLGGLVGDQSVTLALTATVDPGTSGTTLNSQAQIAASDQSDPVNTNDSASVDISVNDLDLQVLQFVDDPHPAENDLITLHLVLANQGPAPATGVVLSDLLPAGLTFQSATPSQGTYDSGTGLWNLGSVAAADNQDLTISATVDAGTGGSNLTNTAAVSSVDQMDNDGSNDSVAQILVISAAGSLDLQLSQSVDNGTPNVGDTVIFTLTTANAGPGQATGIQVTDALPGEVTFVSALSNKGSYDSGSGIWDIGTLDEGFQGMLTINAVVNNSAVGAAINNTAFFSALDQTDSNSDNNIASVSLAVPYGDLQMSLGVDNAAPEALENITFSLSVLNDGPNFISGAQIQDLLPTTLNFVSSTTSQGTYDEATGLWAPGGLSPEVTATLSIVAQVDAEAAGSTITNTAAVVGADQADPNPGNNLATTTLVVPGADLSLDLIGDYSAVLEGAQVHLTLNLENDGPDNAEGVEVTQLIPAGLTFVSASTSQGTYDSGTGSWSAGSLAPSDIIQLELILSANSGTAGTTLVNTAAITGSSQADADSNNNTATFLVTVMDEIPAGQNVLWPNVGSASEVLPGDHTAHGVLTFSFANRGTQTETLHSLRLTNLTPGDGTLRQMDAEWYNLGLSPRLAMGNIPVQIATLDPVTFTNGQLDFPNLDWAIPAGDTLLVTVHGSPSLQARDGAQLRVGIQQASDLGFDNSFSLMGHWPLVSGQVLEVNGFVAGQATVQPLESGLLSIGSQRNLALAVDLPGNGYLDDTLYGIAVRNNGTAQAGSDISKMEIWSDDGDNTFDPLADQLLGTALFSGDRWQLTGLSVPVPAAGHRFFVTVDINETALSSRDIRLSLPVGNGPAVEMYSDNDGPVDRALESSATLGISVTNRIILSAEWFPSGMVLPGAHDVPLAQFLMTNTYTDSRTLNSLVFTNTSSAQGADQGQQDALFQQADLRLDGNHNSQLDDLATDPAIATGIFSDGRVVFTGLNFDLPAEEAGTRFFVTADLGLHTVADGNRIQGAIDSPVDLDIPGATIVGNWPLASETDWVVNGMIADQIENHGVTILTLGPGEGPVPALDMTIPANGYSPDQLTGIVLHNAGTATAADLASADLWQDGGDGLFDAGSGDDLPLGPLTLEGENWTSTVLAVPLPLTGVRLFVGVTVAETPRDSVTVNLDLPLGGVNVSSGNDGPMDEARTGNSTLVISTSPLRSTLTFNSAATDTGQSGTLTMVVRNAGSEILTSVTPQLMFASGEGLLLPGAPEPEIFPSLDPDEERSFTWTFTSQTPGLVVMQGNAQGLVHDSQIRRSIVTPTSAHHIFTPVSRLDLYPTVNLPFSINRGQAGIVPLTATFINPGGDQVADARLTSLRLRFLETPAGPGIAPAELVDQVVISEGTNIYYASDVLPTNGDELEILLADPVHITGSEPVTLGIRLDLRLNSTVPSFLLSIESADWLTADDAINGSNLPVVIAEGNFPIRTGQATLVSPAAGMNIAVSEQAPGTTIPGQTGIQLMEFNLSQALGEDLSSSIDLGRVAFKFLDSNGIPLTQPETRLSHLSLVSSFQEHFSGPPVAVDDSVVVLQLSAPVTITGEASITMRLLGDVAEDSPLGTITPVLAAVDYFDARDGNMNNPVSVSITTSSAGPALSILGPATALLAGGSGAMPEQISQGTRDLTAMTLTLANAGDENSSPVRCDSLTLHFFNAARQPLAPDAILDRIRLMSGDQELGAEIQPSAQDGLLGLALHDLILTAGQSKDLRLSLDFNPSAPSEALEVVVTAADIIAVDTLSGLPLAIDHLAGTNLPLSSGLGTLVYPADELTVAAASLMPPMLPVQETPIPVLSLTFSNPAGEGSGGVQVDSLVFGSMGDKAAPQHLGQFLRRVEISREGTLIAATDSIETAATNIILRPDEPAIIAAGQNIEVVVSVLLREDCPSGSLGLLLQESGVGAGPPGGSGLEVRVLPASGQVFPFTTELGTVSSAGLKESYVNYPNPFAAGRESTHFAFSLARDARVNLRIMTPHGELVANLLQNEFRTAGFYQSDQWSGTNGNGSPVHNGVYLAELVVQYNDGSQERILRKVAVVR